MALKYKNDRRKIDPAVYNHRRLSEKPYPILQTKQTKKHVKRTKPKKQTNRINNFNNPLDTPPNSPVLASDQDDSLDTLPNSTESRIDQDERNSEVHTESADDVICLSSNVGHRPMKEYDIISGRFTFARTVSSLRICMSNSMCDFLKFLEQALSDRVYEVNGKRFQLKKDVIDRLLYYNKSPTGKNSPQIDKVFLELLLLSIFNVNDLKMNRFDTDLLRLTKCKHIQLSLSNINILCVVLFFSQIFTKIEWVGIRTA